VSTEASHLRFIDGLRGVAVLVVMCRHYYMDIYHYGLPRWADAMGLGYLGVHLFLLLSGFCIAWAYVGPRARPLQVGEFAYRRATRILPPYYLVLLISLILWLNEAPHSTASIVAQLATHLTMTHNLHASTVLALNGPFWSLALESQLYVFFPLLLLGFRKWGVAAVLGVVFVAQLAFRLAVLRYGTDYNDTTFVLPWSVAGRLFEFTLGMYGAQLVAHGLGQRLGLAARAGLAAAVLTLVGLALIAKRQLGVSHPLVDLAWTGAFFSLLIAASSPRGVLHWILSRRLVSGLGIICYSTYLIHALVLGSVANAVLKAFPNRSPLLLTPVVFAPVILICYVFYRLVEYPSLQYFKTLRRRVVQPAVNRA
jgi:peptidoglycan/LPS O-acetylase OafA/YrhL